MGVFKEILLIIFSWPFVAIIAILVLRKPIYELVLRLINSDSWKAKIWPVEIELGKIVDKGNQVVDKLNAISYIMAESRLLELEITDSLFSTMLTEKQRSKMLSHIEELKNLTKK